MLPEKFGGVWLCDDDCGAISAEHYRQFVVPYMRGSSAFGGGTMHFCGTAEQQLENFLHIEGLLGINNFCMGNFRQVFRMQELYRDRLVLKVCDFTPLRIRPYYAELLSGLKRNSTILGTFIARKWPSTRGNTKPFPAAVRTLPRRPMPVFGIWA